MTRRPLRTGGRHQPLGASLALSLRTDNRNKMNPSDAEQHDDQVTVVSCPLLRFSALCTVAISHLRDPRHDRDRDDRGGGMSAMIGLRKMNQSSDHDQHQRGEHTTCSAFLPDCCLSSC